jgi:hypothetical protein
MDVIMVTAGNVLGTGAGKTIGKNTTMASVGQRAHTAGATKSVSVMLTASTLSARAPAITIND